NEEAYVKAPTAEQEVKLRELDQKITAAEAKYEGLKSKLAKTQQAWELWVRNSQIPDWNVRDGLVLHFPLDGNLREETGVYERLNSSGRQLSGDQKESDDPKRPVVGGAADPAGALPFAPGKVGMAGSFDGRVFVNAGKVACFNYLDPFTLAAWVYPKAPNGAIMSSVEDVHEGTGYGLYLRDAKVRFHYTVRWTDLGMRLETQRPLELDRWHHVVLTYDGKRKASGVKIYVDGQEQPTKILFDAMVWPLDNKAQFRIDAGDGPEDRFRGTIDEVRVYNRALSPEEAATLPVLETVPQIGAIPPRKRSPAQA